MAIVLEPKTSYNLISRTESSNNKLLVHVKLTDSCLRALEEYQLVEVSSRRKPSIKFSGLQGSISIPLRKADSGDDNTAQFQLDCSAIQSGGRQGVMDCIQQPGGSSDIRTVGTITHKINVKATDDSYQMTQQRMKEAEEERKGVSTKVLNTAPKKGSKKIFKKHDSVLAQIRSGSRAKVSSGPSKTLRDRVIHLLAVKPFKKPELISKLTKDGVSLKDRNSLTSILQQVAVMTDNQYRLLKHLYSEVQVETWPNYSEAEKQLVRRKKKSEMNDSSLVTSSSSSPPKSIEATKQKNKRICPSEAERSSKRQRISHIKNNNNIIKDPDQKSPNSADKSKLSKTSLTESTEPVSLPDRQVVESSTTEKSLNGVNGLDSPEFMRKYKPITSYEQRCLYKKDFQEEYEEYIGLKEKTEPISIKFTDLQSKRLQFPEKSTERQAIDKEIQELYVKVKKDPLWQQTKARCLELHTKLSYIKGLITAYDKSAANT
ncbi:RNA polymerase II elongation factor ELL-like [Orbicella faveolata]|uniref:RNA polymerase II elongation factor ELL-like n=1 Tax=Orbicella faveolata TaxID=48498 RepID=UPI0009E514B8|nr:RNA polymerase II elongation factor ELL-like [Orbicella faveolata]